MAGGRPTKYRPEMCATVEEMMAEGCSKVEVCAELGICYDTWLIWQGEHKEFSESVKTGETLSAAWWEKQGRQNLATQGFNATLWYMNMKNRHGWKDKTETALTGADGGPIEIKGIDVAFIKSGKD